MGEMWHFVLRKNWLEARGANLHFSKKDKINIKKKDSEAFIRRRCEQTNILNLKKSQINRASSFQKTSPKKCVPIKTKPKPRLH